MVFPSCMISLTRVKPYVSGALECTISTTPVAIDNPNGNTFDAFGEALYVTAAYIAVGAPETEDTGDGDPNQYFGKAYLFDVDGTQIYDWSNYDLDAAGDGAGAQDEFGTSIGITDNYILVGAPFEDFDANQRGRVYVYNLSDGAYNNTFELNVGGVTATTPLGYFGQRMAVGDGEFVLIAAPELSITNSRSAEGRCIAVEAPASTGFIVGNPAFPVGGTGDTVNSRFGHACAGGGGYYVVGSPRLDNSSNDSVGGAWIYDQTDNNDTVTLLWSLESPSPADDYQFGHAVAINSTYCAVTELSDVLTATPNTVHIFESATGNFVRTISNPGSGIRFGESLAMSEEYLVIGDNDNETTNGNAAVYVYDPSGENLLYTLTNPTSSNSGFGGSVGISTTVLAVGARKAALGGKVYTYEVTCT